MGNNEQLNTAWLTRLTNPHHDGTTQQIDDFVQSFVTDNARFLEKRTAVHQCRQKEDEVWMKAQRDPAVKRLDAADNRQDAYVSAARYIINAVMRQARGRVQEEKKEAEKKNRKGRKQKSAEA